MRMELWHLAEDQMLMGAITYWSLYIYILRPAPRSRCLHLDFILYYIYKYSHLDQFNLYNGYRMMLRMFSHTTREAYP